MNYELFDKFRGVLCDDAAPVGRDSRLLIERQGDIEVFYTPFEHLNKLAKIALVGITPGDTQMANANAVARTALLAGKSTDEILKVAKDVAAFSGDTIRANLINQLNHWGFNKWLGLDDCAELFGSSRHLVHTTSLLRYPVFKAGQKYNGQGDMARNPVLRKYLLDYFAKEVAELGGAIFISLGPVVHRVLDQLIKEDVIAKDRVVSGMLHPSGENNYRFTYLLGDRVGMAPYRTCPVSYDAGRAAFRNRHNLA
jgi:hypothetical protein